MATAGIDLNDACISVVQAGEVLVSEIGYATLADGGVRFGPEAWALSRLRPRETDRRYWRELTDLPLARQLGPAGTPADLVRMHLERLWSHVPPDSDAAILTVPAYWSAAQLSRLLGIARDAGIPVGGLVDAAVAACRRPAPNAQLWHLDVTLHDLSLTHIDQSDGMRLAHRESVPFGLEVVFRTLAQFFARCFLETSRFDPLHDADSEQRLYDELHDWSGRLLRAETASLQLSYRGNEFHARARADQLHAAMADALEPLIRKLRTLATPGASLVLQLPALLAEIPGVVEALMRLPGFALTVLAPGEAARGALRLRPQPGAEGHALVKQLPWDQPALQVSSMPGMQGSQRGSGPAAPTHLLFDGTAYLLGAEAFHIGQELSDQEFGLALGSRASGVSRSHCTVQCERGLVTLHDHSRYGTWLNGHRVQNSAILQAGDRIAVGQPAIEFVLITEARSRGTPA